MKGCMQGLAVEKLVYLLGQSIWMGGRPLLAPHPVRANTKSCVCV